MAKHQRAVHSRQDQMPSRFSYPKKAITMAAAANVQRYKKFSGKLQRRMIHSAAELVGIVPFDWFREKDIFIMFFGLDTFESAVAVRTKLVNEGYLVSIWNSEEEMDMVGAALRQFDAAGREVGPITDSDGNELDFDWRSTPKTN